MIRWTLTLLILASLGLAGPALAVFPPPPKDDGKFFSKEGLDKASKKIRAIYENYKKDVVVETHAALTAEQEKKLKEEGATKFFGKMANDRSKEIGLNGVFILLLKKPQFLQIYMDPETQKKAFKPSNRTATFKKMVAQFKEEMFDAGLADALAEIESAFKANSK